MTKLTPRDVIGRSLTMHPTLLAESLEHARSVHIPASNVMMDRPAQRIVVSMADSCAMAANAIRNGADDATLELIMSDTAAWGAALLAACKLQCLGPGAAHEITAGDYDDGEEILSSRTECFCGHREGLEPLLAA